MPEPESPPAASPRGRKPRAIGRQQKARLIRLASLGHGRTLVCLVAGVSYRQFYRAIRVDPEFRAAFDAADRSARDPETLAERWAAAGGDRLLARRQAARLKRSEATRKARAAILRGVLSGGVVPRAAALRTVDATARYFTRGLPKEERAAKLAGLREDLAGRPGLLSREDLTASADGRQAQALAELEVDRDDLRRGLARRRAELDEGLAHRRATLDVDVAMRRAELAARHPGAVPPEPANSPRGADLLQAVYETAAARIAQAVGGAIPPLGEAGPA